MKFYSLFILLILGFVNGILAQDLILDAQKGIFIESIDEQSLVAQRVKETLTKSTPVTPFRYISTTKGNNNIIQLELDNAVRAQLLAAKSSALRLQIPVDSEHTLDLELYQTNILSSDFMTTYKKEQQEEYVVPETVFYWGVVKNHWKSRVAVSIFEEEMTISIIDNRGHYTLGKQQDDSLYVFYNEDTTLPDFEIGCETDDSNYEVPAESRGRSKNLEKSNGCPVQVYIVADKETYDNKGENADEYIMGFFNLTAILYGDEGIPMEISEIYVYTTSDPFGSGTTRQKLGIFGGHIRNNFNGDLAHLVTVKENQNSISGIAWLNQLCRSFNSNQNSGPYGYSEVLGQYSQLPSYSGTVGLFTHELGHNLGSPHTHACEWGANGNQALDNCASSSCSSAAPGPANGVGTIMSYCRPRALNFLAEPIQLMRNRYNYATGVNGCISCENTCIGDENINGNDIGSGTYQAGNRLSSTGRVRNNRNVVFQAGSEIVLGAGFSVDAGARFAAEVTEDACLQGGSEEAMFRDDTPNTTPKIADTEEVLYNNLEFYPNPNSGQLNLNYELIEADFFQVSIYDFNGKLIQTLLTESKAVIGKYQTSFDISQLPKGMYYVTWRTSQEQQSKKLIVF